MSMGFDLRLDAAQSQLRDRLHAVARDEFRLMADQAERDGLDPALLAHQLEVAGVAPGTLLERGVDSPHTLLIAVEELAYGDAGIAWAAVPALQIAMVLTACGTSAQRDRARQTLADPGATAAVMLYEDFGRQPSEYETRFSGPGPVVRADGAKRSVSFPAGADVSLLVGRDAGDNGDLAAYCFTGRRAGLVAERDDREVGKVAVTAVPSGPVAVEGLTLTDDERLTGGIALHRAVGQARLLLAATLLGLARASVEFAAAYATERTTWGQPIANHQGVSFPLVDLTTELSEVRLLVWDVASRLTQLSVVEAIEDAVARAVNRASSLGLRVTRNGVQLVGVRGISRDLPCERWYREGAVLGAVDFDILRTPFGLS
jgi:alkylation response protein AidB-like acyl-CoA dehydrogenase